ncbi:hypothetical protein SLA2020_384810 [Shorea laevis]
MEQSETLDLSSPSLSSSDPQLSRSLSSSRLNAQAPEFVLIRPAATQSQQQQAPHRIIVTPPSPPAMLHVYPPAPPFHVPVHSPVPMPAHMVPVHHHVPVWNHQNHHHHHQYYGGGSGEQEGEVGKRDIKDQKDHSASLKNGPSEEAVQKILNQVRASFTATSIIPKFLLIQVRLTCRLVAKSNK